MASIEPDFALVKRAQQGDKSAFSALVAKYQIKIVKLIVQHIRDPSEAVDVAQESFMRAYRALPNFRGESAFYTWFYRIAVNTAKNSIQMRARRSREEDIDFDEALLLDAPGRLRNFDTPEELAMSDEMAGIIKTGFDSLPGELGEALALREMEGYSYDEIAAIMHCPVGTVRSRIFRAREAMDKALLEYLYH